MYVRQLNLHVVHLLSHPSFNAYRSVTFYATPVTRVHGFSHWPVGVIIYDKKAIGLMACAYLASKMEQSKKRASLVGPRAGVGLWAGTGRTREGELLGAVTDTD